MASSTAPRAAPAPIVTRVRTSYVDGKLRLNQYTFLRAIGRGAYAEVVLARDELVQQYVALKCFSKSRLTKKRDIRRVAGSMVVITGLDKVQVEIQLLRALGSRPTVVGLRAVLADPASDDLYLVMDLADAGPLMDTNEATGTFSSRAVGGGVLPLSLARQCLADLLAALVDLRALGIAHRDIKPENLLLGSNGRLRVADFGVAQQFAVPGVSDPVRSALARALSAIASGAGSDAGASSGVDSDADDGSDDGESDVAASLPLQALGATPVSPALGGLAVAAAVATPRLSLASSRRSSRTAPRPPGWVSDTAGTFSFLAPEACGSSGGYDAFGADLWACVPCEGLKGGGTALPHH